MKITESQRKVMLAALDSAIQNEVSYLDSWTSDHLGRKVDFPENRDVVKKIKKRIAAFKKLRQELLT